MLLLDEDDEPLLDESLLDEPLDPLPESEELLASLAPVILIWNDWVALKLPSETLSEKESETLSPALRASIAALLGV